jgi:hypothetical protein
MGVIALYFIDYVVEVSLFVEMMATYTVSTNSFNRSFFIFIAASLFFYRVRAQCSQWE